MSPRIRKTNAPHGRRLLEGIGRFPRSESGPASGPMLKKVRVGRKRGSRIEFIGGRYLAVPPEVAKEYARKMGRSISDLLRERVFQQQGSSIMVRTPISPNPRRALKKLRRREALAKKRTKIK